MSSRDLSSAALTPATNSWTLASVMIIGGEESERIAHGAADDAYVLKICIHKRTKLSRGRKADLLVLVGHEFDRRDQCDAAHFTNQRMVGQRTKADLSFSPTVRTLSMILSSSMMRIVSSATADGTG